MNIAAANLGFSKAVATMLMATGVRRAVLSPGARSTPMVVALSEHPDIELDVVLDERVAGFMALGIARASGHPVALLCTSGSAGAHYMPALIEAYYSRIPLIALTADRPYALQHCGAPQTIVQNNLFGAQVRGFAQGIEPTGHQDPSAQRASLQPLADVMTQCTAPIPGPVHINLPFRKPLWTHGVQATPFALPSKKPATQKHEIQTHAFDALATEWATKPRGVIVCGPQPGPLVHAGFQKAVVALGQQLGWPLLADPASQVRFGSTPTHGTITAFDALLRHAPFAHSTIPDVVLRFGLAPTSKSLSDWLVLHGCHQAVGIDGAGIFSDPEHTMGHHMICDPTHFCQQMLLRLQPQVQPSPWQTLWSQAETKARHCLDDLGGDALWEGVVIKEVVNQLASGDALHVGNGLAVRDLDTWIGPRGKNISVFVNRGANGIDGTLATAVGEASQHSALFAITGDLSLLHDIGALVACAQTQTNITCVVLNNGGGRIFEQLPIAQHTHVFERYFLTPQSANIGSLCQGAKVPHRLVTTKEELCSALQWASCTTGLRVIEACIEQQVSASKRTAAFKAVACAIGETHEKS